MQKKLNCIMIVDDDEPTNYLHEKIIKAADIAEHVRVFDDAMIALDYLSNSLEAQDRYYQRPDLILLDINMPRTSGWEFIEEYRKHPRAKTEGVIIMMLTTSLNPDDREKANTIHEIAGFYTKPLDAELLDQILRTHFAGRN